MSGDWLRIGARTTHAAVGADERVPLRGTLLTHATPLIGHFQIRNQGTLGGSIAHADPAAEYPAVAVALDAEMETLSPTGGRTIAATEFFTGVWETRWRPDEILTAVRFPVWSGRRGFAVEFARRHGDFAIAGRPSPSNSTTMTVFAGAGSLLGLGSTPRRARRRPNLSSRAAARRELTPRTSANCR